MVFSRTGIIHFNFKEIAYSVFVFQDTITINLNNGVNKIVIESTGDNNNIVYLREISAPDEPVKSKFIPASSKINNFTWPWCFYISDNNIDYGFSSNSLYNMLVSSSYPYIVPQPHLLKKLIINPLSTFKKDSFADWNYPNGILMMVMNDLSSECGNNVIF